jgi:hypothetical protein
MALRTFAPRTFLPLTFASGTLNGEGLGGPAPVITPASILTLPVRSYEIALDARSYTLTLVAQSPQVVLPPRSYSITLLPRGQGGAVALSLGKQPSESFLYSVLAQQYLPVGRTIASVELFASRKDTLLSASVTSIAAADATTLLMSASPGRGARMTVNAAGGTAEVVKANAVTGTGPYSVTVVPALMFAHSPGEPVDYEPGFSLGVLVSTAPTVGTQIIYPHVTRGVHGHTYRISMLMTLDNGDVIEAENELVVADT